MLITHKTPIDASRRGTVMLVTLVLGLALASAVMYSMSDTMTTQDVNAREGNYAAALAAAEYGVELGIAGLSRGLIRQADEFGRVNDRSVVMGDFVLGPNMGVGTLYREPGGEISKDQRRIGGTFNDQEFRVRIRSARQAYENDYVGNDSTHTLPVGWLKDPGEFAYGIDKAYQFSDVYEITGTARHINSGDANLGGRRAETAVVQAIISLAYESETGRMLERMGVVNVEEPEHFAVTGGMTDVIDLDAVLMPGEPQAKKSVYNIMISGEDHLLSKQHMEAVINDPIVEPLRLTTNEANYFGALGTYWTTGLLTLNYRMSDYARELDPSSLDDVNPYRPLSKAFGTSNTDRAMMVQDPNRMYDTYLLGGKPAKTVRFVEPEESINGIPGKILETSSSQALEGGNFNIVLGKFEDLRNLYINMAGVVGTFTNPNDWFQMYVGQYTNSPRSATTVANSLPNYGGSKIRAQTVHLMQNEKGQKLVRLYSKGTGSSLKYYKYKISGGTWTGYYCWADATFNGNGVMLTKNVTATGNIPGEKSGERAVARTFFWQELVGYQLVRRIDKGITSHPYEPAIIEQRDLPVSGQKIDKRTMYRTDSEGKRIPAGFDEIYQGYFEGIGSGSHTHPLASTKYNNEVSPGYLQDRNDSIYVWNDDGSITTHKDMNAFLFEKDFGEVDLDGNPAPRQALNLFIAYEDQRETTADYNYTDMMFNIYVAPQVEAKITDFFVVAPTSRQWWERDERDGLTGDTSHYAIGTNEVLDEDAVAPQDLRQAHYDLFDTKVDPLESGEYSLAENIWTMGDDDGYVTDFPRAVFVYENGKYNTGVLDVSNKVVERYYKGKNWRTFYYSKGDLLDYIQYVLMVDSSIQIEPAGWYIPAIGDWNYDKAIAEIQDRNPGITFLEIEERWEMDEKNRMTADTGEALVFIEKPLEVRAFASKIVGGHTQDVPVINTTNFEVENIYDTANMETMGFLPGEFNLKNITGYEWAVTGIYDWDHFLPRQDVLTFPEEQDDGTLRTDTVKGYFAPNPSDVVNMCYENFYAGDVATQNYLMSEYGVKEKRYSIGFHRGGTDKILRNNLLQDRYEIIILGQTGFNPYREAEGANARFIAKDLGKHDRRNPSKDVRRTLTNYPAQGGVAPVFEFNKPIDGAGALIVNGDLVIRDTFAYYGSLVVLGDIHILPTLKKEMVMNSEGNPVDYRGHSLFLKEKTNEWDPDEWYYVWQYIDEGEGVIHGGDEDADRTYIQLKTDKSPLLDDEGNEIPVQPFMQDVVRGELFVQGNLVVKGRIYTGTLELDGTEEGEEEEEEQPPILLYQLPIQSNDALANQPILGGKKKTYYGKLTALWSREAVGVVSDIWSQGGEAASRITWVHDDNIPVDNIWNDKNDVRYVPIGTE